MARSASTIPHVTNFDDADITELERIRKGGMADYVDSNVKLTMMAFVMKAVAQSLKLHPMLNASLDMENEQIIYKEYVNIGVAVDTERGLVVPVIRDVDRMSIPQIAQALTDVAEQGRAGAVLARRSARRRRSRSATWARSAAPIRRRSSISPDVAILLVGRSRKLPVVIDDKIEIAADDAAEPVVRSPPGRRRRRGPVPERSDQLPQGARPAAAGAVANPAGTAVVLI